MVSSVQATPSSVVQVQNVVFKLASVNWVLDVDSVGLPGPSSMCGAGYDTTIRLGWMITDMDDCETRLVRGEYIHDRYCGCDNWLRHSQGK